MQADGLGEPVYLNRQLSKGPKGPGEPAIGMLGKMAPGEGNSRCKDPDVRMSVVCLRVKKDSVGREVR